MPHTGPHHVDPWEGAVGPQACDDGPMDIALAYVLEAYARADTIQLRGVHRTMLNEAAELIRRQQARIHELEKMLAVQVPV